MSRHGKIEWSELVTPDVDAAKAYYAKMCGWDYTEMNLTDEPYYVANQDGQPVAGVMNLAELKDPNIPPHWMTYIAVDDIDKVADETAKSGGTVVQPPFDIPGVGRIAILRDPTGATVGMMTPSSDG